MEDPLLNEPVMFYLTTTNRVINIVIAKKKTTLSWQPKAGLEGVHGFTQTKTLLTYGSMSYQW
jgi:hypothetical protein